MKSGIVLAILLFAAPALADNADQAKVEAFLKAHGYTEWKSITLDGGTWEVDDAIRKGKKFDLRISAAHLKITFKIAE